MNVLIVEDEKDLATEVAQFLKREHYTCDVAGTGREASEMIAVNKYNFILLDLGLPDYDGLDLLDEAREENPEAAVLILSARGTVEDRVKGLNKGADDYLPKPFSLLELLSRMQAIMRRNFGIKAQLIPCGEFMIDLQNHQLLHGQTEVKLTRKEIDLLSYLVLHKGRVLSRMQLTEHIWGNISDGDYDSNYIDAHIKNIRRKVSQHGSIDWLETVRGIGYRADLP